MHFPRFVALVAISCYGLPVFAADAGKDSAPVRPAIERGLAFLAEEGENWKETRKCASCHHVPMMIWSLNEAKNLGYKVDDKKLADVTSWALSANDPAKLFPAPPKPGAKKPDPKQLSQSLMMMSLAFEAIPQVEPAAKEGMQRVMMPLLSQQADEGTWSLPGGGRPPLVDSKDIMTTWTLMALDTRTAPNKIGPSVEASRTKAIKWLTSVTPAESHQAVVLRLLFLKRIGRASADFQPLVQNLIKRQNVDGGWSQTRDRPSDAYATGQTLYALSLAGVKPETPAIERSVAFLIRTQKSDGSWIVLPRPDSGKKEASKNKGPITYASSAWAVLGLVRTFPATADRKVAKDLKAKS